MTREVPAPQDKVDVDDGEQVYERAMKAVPLAHALLAGRHWLLTRLVPVPQLMLGVQVCELPLKLVPVPHAPLAGRH